MFDKLVKIVIIIGAALGIAAFILYFTSAKKYCEESYKDPTHKKEAVLIYSCVFFNRDYIKLLDLLFKSYVQYGQPESSNLTLHYLIVCSPDFKAEIQNMFDKYKIIGDIWTIDLKTKLEACCARLQIFNYPKIYKYSKLLYLDTDILVTNNISKIVEFPLENKLYTLSEGNTSDPTGFWGADIFADKKVKNPGVDAFTSGILLFPNNKAIKKLFKKIRKHINVYTKKHAVPVTFDQPFIVYHAITKNLYNNEKITKEKLAINNPEKYGSEIISHFPGGPGNYESKVVKMSDFMNNVMVDAMVDENQKKQKQKYIIQVGAHVGNTENDKLFGKLKSDIIYILIEPVPYLYKQLSENYKNKSNVILLNIAISNKTDPLTLYIPSEKNNFSELPMFASQLASTNKDHLNIHIPNLIVEQISVECKTLNNIIEEYKIENLEAIYTDTEGHDYEILMDLDVDLLNVPPKSIIFEHKHLDGTNSYENKLSDRPKYLKLLEKFKSLGYYIYHEDSQDCELKLK